MILAAGRGDRMRPLTDSTPKPLIPVAGRSMLDRSMDRLAAHGVRTVVVNVHHLGEQIARHLDGRARIVHENRLLETGGSVKNALPLLGDGPYFILNGDGLWRDGPLPMLSRMDALWDPARMDALLLLHPTVSAVGYDGVGDYFMETDGMLRRRIEERVAPFVFTGVQILSPALFKGARDGAFSLRDLYDRAQEAGRLFGVRHDGLWFHVGTPDSVSLAEELMAGRKARDQA
jgi:MurNAc alpha-1-phosphate uridylyltransferase